MTGPRLTTVAELRALLLAGRAHYAEAAEIFVAHCARWPPEGLSLAHALTKAEREQLAAGLFAIAGTSTTVH